MSPQDCFKFIAYNYFIENYSADILGYFATDYGVWNFGRGSKITSPLK